MEYMKHYNETQRKQLSTKVRSAADRISHAKEVLDESGLSFAVIDTTATTLEDVVVLTTLYCHEALEKLEESGAYVSIWNELECILYVPTPESITCELAKI